MAALARSVDCQSLRLGVFGESCAAVCTCCCSTSAVLHVVTVAIMLKDRWQPFELAAPELPACLKVRVVSARNQTPIRPPPGDALLSFPGGVGRARQSTHQDHEAQAGVPPVAACAVDGRGQVTHGGRHSASSVTRLAMFQPRRHNLQVPCASAVWARANVPSAEAPRVDGETREPRRRPRSARNPGGLPRHEDG